MYDAYYERRRQGLLREEEFQILLPRLQEQGYWIGCIRLRFLSSRRIYALHTTNILHQERVWAENRDFFDVQIQQWINNAYLGNTRSKKRWHDNGWQLIGRWERGEDGFLHVHAFLAVYTGPGCALGCDLDELMERLQKRTYHPQLPNKPVPNKPEARSVHIAAWRNDPERQAVRYFNKQAWRLGTGEDLLFARAPV